MANRATQRPLVDAGPKPAIPSGSHAQLSGTLRFQMGLDETLEANGSYFYVDAEEARIDIAKTDGTKLEFEQRLSPAEEARKSPHFNSSIRGGS